MARKEAPKIDPVDLYEERIVYVVEYLDGSAYGRWAGPGTRVNSVTQAHHFGSYEDAHNFIVRNMVDNVSIVKAWV